MLTAAGAGQQGGAAAMDLDTLLPFAKEIPAECELPLGDPSVLVTIDIGSVFTGYVPSDVEDNYDPDAPVPDLDDLRRIRDLLRPNNFTKPLFARAGGVDKEVSRIAIQTVEACLRECNNMAAENKEFPLYRKTAFGDKALQTYRQHPESYVVYENFKIPLHPDSSDRRPDGNFVRAEDVTCDAILGDGRAFAVELYALTVGKCIERACLAKKKDSHELGIGLLCPDSWDELTRIAVTSAVLRLKHRVGNTTQHLRRCQIVWLRESQASFLSAVVDIPTDRLPAGKSTAVVADIGGHTTDLMGMTIENIPNKATRLRDVLAQRGRRLGGNEVNDTLGEFIFLHFLKPIGVDREMMFRNKQAVHLVLAEIEELKKDHDPDQIATTDALAADPRLSTYYEINLRNLEKLFQDAGIRNWMEHIRNRVEKLNKRKNTPLKFIDSDDDEQPQIQGIAAFRRVLANHPYVQGDATGGFGLENGVLKLPTKLFETVLNLHAGALKRIVADFITNLNKTPRDSVAPGGTMDLREEDEPEDENRALAPVEAVLFTGEGATGAAHRKVLQVLEEQYLAPNQGNRMVSFPEGTSTHCLKGGHLILMHHRHIQPTLRCPVSYGARLNVFVRDQPANNDQPAVLKQTLVNAGITKAVNREWDLWIKDGPGGKATVDIVVPAVQADQIVRVNETYQFGEPQDVFRIPANSDFQLDLYQVARPMPKLGNDAGLPPMLISRRKRRPGEVTPPAPPANLPILSFYSHGVARYLHRNDGPESQCRTFIRFSAQGAVVVELQLVEVRDGAINVLSSHVMKADAPPQARLELIGPGGGVVPANVANAQVQAQVAMAAGAHMAAGAALQVATSALKKRRQENTSDVDDEDFEDAMDMS